jgi:osmoprotectant transport system ATP-binding protein
MIEVQDLTKRYGTATVVDRVSLSVAQGEVLVLVGGSGSGKTTTLKMINRLIEPTEGKVFIEGRDASELDGPALRRRIGYVFQRIGLFPHMTVAENISVPLSLLGWGRPRIRERVEQLLGMVELEAATAGRRPAELSGGQQQRVGVARALAAEPKLMLLDEPFGALDALTRDRLQQTFLELQRQLRLTAVFVTHDLSEAILIADRIAVLNEGRLVQVGAPRELLHAPSDAYVERLLETPRRQARAFDSLMALSGEPP